MSGTTTGPMGSRNAELIIVALQPEMISVEVLQRLFTEASAVVKRGKGRPIQTATVQLKNPDSGVAIPLNISPFMHYSTYLVKSDWETYRKDFFDYPFPSELDLGNIKKPKQDLSPARMNDLVNIVHSRRVIATTEDRVKSQTQVMGVGAREIATAFSWPNPDPDKKVVAEWLHRSAFSWKGIQNSGETPDVTQQTSQVPRNMIFGSAECNKVMTRYETAWIYLFTREHELRKLYLLPGPEVYLEGWLTSDIRSFDGYTSQTDSPFMIPLTPTQQANRKKCEAEWPWLCYVMRYILELWKTGPTEPLGPPSWILGAVPLVDTEFFPFQRRFFTQLEGKVDTMIIDELFKRYKDTNPLPAADGPAPHPNRPPRQLRRMMSPARAKKSIRSSSRSHRTNVHDDLYRELRARARARARGIFPSIRSKPTHVTHHNPHSVTSLHPGTKSNGTSSASPRTEAHNELWRTMLKGPGSIPLDHVTLHNPRFVMINDRDQVIDVSPTSVVSSSKGHAELIQKRGHGGGLGRPSNRTAHVPTPPEFVVKGDIKIFGILTATLSTIQNPAVVGVSQRVELIGDLSLGKLIPELLNTPLDTISLKHTSFTYRSTFRGSSPPGVRFYTDIMPTGELLQPVFDVLHKVFGQKDPTLTFSGFTGYEPTWGKPFKPMGFSLRAGLRKLDINLWDVINVTDLSLSLAFTREIDLYQNRKGSGYSMSSTFTGAAGVKIPGSVIPMRVNWYMKKFGKSYVLSLDMQDDEWADAFGIPNLKLADVQFDVSFSIVDLAKSLTLGIQATLQLQQQMITLSGSYSKSDWSAEGVLQDVTLELLHEIYLDLFKKPLATVPDNHNIVFTSLRLRIGKGSFVFEGSVSLKTYTSASAVVTLSSVGLEIQGAVENVQLQHSHGPTININTAAIDVFIGPLTEGARQFSVGLYFNRSPGKESEYTLYGTVLHGNLKLSSIAPGVKDTFLDLELTNIALIMSNQQEQWDQVPHSFKYKVKEGFQICATVHKLRAVEKLTKPNGGMGLILSAAYSGTELVVGVEWPKPGTISFNRNIKSGPISLQLVISDNPSLSFKADLLIKVAKRAKPLELEFLLTAGETQATGQAAMQDTWMDPFNISPAVSIGNLLFGVTIIYEEFFESGIPKEVTLGGNLPVGESKAALLIDVSENPDDELISIHLEKLDFSDLVAFATKIVGEPIPAPKSPDILTIQKFDLYMSTGVTVNKKHYPAGVQFDCSILVFKHHAAVSATIDKGIILNGSVDSFLLGGLTVKGFKDTNPSIGITMTPTVQKIKIDGSITALGITIALSLIIEIENKPVFSLELQVKFADLLSFTLKATMIGESSGKSTDTLDFMLTAEFKQDLLDHLVNEANDYFKRLNDATNKGFQIASEKLNKTEAGYKMELTNASLKLKQDKQAWDEKREKENKAFAKGKADVDAKVDSCRKWLKQKHGELDLAIKNAEKVLEQANQKLAVEVKKAQDDIALAAKHADDEIDVWRRDVTKKAQEVAVIGGNWNASIDTAKAAVASALAAVAHIDDSIKNKNSEIKNAHWYSVPGLKIEMYALELEKDVLDSAHWLATKTLDVAKAAVDEAVFVGAQAALTLANDALEVGKRANDAAADDLEQALQAGKDLCTRAVTVADNTLKLVQTSGLEHLAFVGAGKSLELTQSMGDGSIAALQATVNALEKSAEFILFTASGKALDLANKNMKDLDPERLVVNAEHEEELVIEGVAKELIEGMEDLLAVKSVKIKGKLSSGLKGGSLKTVIVVVIDKKTYTYNLDFNLGDVENFLKLLWGEVWKELKTL